MNIIDERRYTISDIAKEAGVSKATVSRVVSHPELVNAETRRKILSIMEKYAYIPNHLAQGLAGTPTKTIGVVIDELSNFFFIEVAEGIDKVIDPLGYSMQLSSSRWVKEREITLVRKLISSRVDGVLLAPISPDSPSIAMMQRAKMPFVLINCINNSNSVSYVSCDNVKGGEVAATYINTLKKEQVIAITGFSHQTVTDRLKGFTDFLDKTTILKQYPDVKTLEDGYQLVPLLIARDKISKIKTTLFVANDNVAVGVINRLIEYNIAIPEQVSVVGYDNIRLSNLCRVPLTTISQSIFDMGRIAALELMEIINSNDDIPRRHLIEPTLITRESS